MQHRFAVIQFPGTNCERETARVLRDLLGQSADVLWHADAVPLDGYDAVVLPGGFAHGDHLRAGAIARFSPIMKSVEAFANSGGLVLGICNGFQVLLESNLLPGAMLRNASLRFRSVWVNLKVERTDTAFTNTCSDGQVLRMPIAHGEGNYALETEADLERVEAAGGVLVRYADDLGLVTDDANPNGATANIAGVMNANGNVFGLMPHPERACETVLGSDDGIWLFRSMIKTLDAAPKRVLEEAHVG
jgi:phosphoribosylformylglycinamidine synthase